MKAIYTNNWSISFTFLLSYTLFVSNKGIMLTIKLWNVFRESILHWKKCRHKSGFEVSTSWTVRRNFATILSRSAVRFKSFYHQTSCMSYCIFENISFHNECSILYKMVGKSALLLDSITIHLCMFSRIQTSWCWYL